MQAIKKEDIKDIYYLSPMQEGMLFHYILDKSSSAYLEQFALQINGKLDVGLLQDSFNQILDRYDIFRTAFIYEKVKRPIQTVLKKRSSQVHYEDIEAMKGEEKARFIEDYKIKDQKHIFDLTTDVLMRLSVLKTGKDQYQLIWSFHHILMDGWCMGIIMREFIQIYISLSAGVPLSLDAVHPYSQYIAWLEKQDKKTAGDYWKNYLTDYSQKAGIPELAGASAQDKYLPKNVFFTLDEDLTAKIEQAASHHKVTVNTFFQSVWGVLLQKYNLVNDAVFGAVISGRPSEIHGIEKIVGLFINTIPVRIRCGAQDSFSGLLKQVQAQALESDRYSYLTLAEIQSGTAIKHGLFDHIIAFENYPVEKAVSESGGEGGELEILNVDVFEQTNYGFNIIVIMGKTLEVKLNFNGLQYDEHFVSLIGGHFRQAVEAVLNHPDIAIQDIQILTDSEKQQLLGEFNGTSRPYPLDKTIQKLIEEQAASKPDNIALVYEGHSLTYADLNTKANQLAYGLIDKGMKKGDLAAIMAEPSLEMIVGILAVLKAGAGYMPIDPSYPAERVRFMLEDSGAKVLLAQARLTSAMNLPESLDVIDLDEKSAYRGVSENPNLSYQKDDTAYVIYTSGSTGQPKGVVVKNRSLVNLASWHNEYYQVSEKDRATKYAGFGFDASVWEIFPYLTAGAAIYIIPDEMKLDVLKLNEYYEKNGISISFLPTQFCELFMENENTSLRALLTGGDKLKRLRKQGYQLFNNYGPTENTVVSTSYLCDNDKSLNIPIGKPIGNVKAYIVGDNNSLQPVGVPGELCVSGESLAAGYLNRPELTADRFVKNPFEEGTGMYRTGDLARWLPGGNIEFLGRIDTQVKIRGFRIELGEIEACILEQKGVQEAVVLKKEDSEGQGVLCAYVVTDSALTAEGLKAGLADKLPSYMVPSAFFFLDKLPLTPNGKVDRNALPEPDGKVYTGAEYEAPRNEVEKKLSEIWASVLGIEKVGIGDNFFELGGHSLKATMTASRIYKELNVEIPLREIFQSPTIKELGQYIRKAEDGIYASIEPSEKREYYPVSSAQKRLYIIDRMEGQNTGYNIPNVMLIEGQIDKDRLTASFKELIKRHEAFRTSFDMVKGEPVQRVHESVDFEVVYRETDENRLTELIQAFIRPFDLSQAPLIRVELYKLNDTKHALCYDMHHIISDEMSMKVLMQEFAVLYNQGALPELRIQYKDFAVWQNKLLQDGSIKKQEEYWLKALSGEVPVLNLPVNYNRPAVQSYEGSTFSVEMPPELIKRLKQTAIDTGTTLFMVLLTAYNILLSRYSGQEDIIVGSPAAGRPHADLENIIGVFVNTLALRNYPAGTKSFKEFLADVKENSLRAFENQDYQFEELVEKLSLRRDLSRSPLFDTMFVMQNTENGQEESGPLSIKQYEFENKVSKFDLTVFATGNEDGLRLTFEYCTRLFNADTIKRMSGHFINLIEALLNKPEVKLSEVDYLSSGEKEQLLKAFNDTAAEYPGEKTIHGLFEEQAQKTPDNTALIFDGGQFSYRELKEKTDSLAEYIQNKGIKPGSVVGILAERSPEMIFGILGVLKAGCAYLPLDPEYPADRADYILKDSRAAALLTQSRYLEKLEFNTLINLDDSEPYASKVPPKKGSIGKSSDLAYIIYTSGSTGKPKGVMIKHSSVVNILTALQTYYPLGQGDTYLFKTTYTFDVSVAELFGWFMDGGRMALLGTAEEKEPAGIIRAIENYHVTHINFVPSMLKILVDTLSEKDVRVLNKLKYLFTAGEALSVNLWERFVKKVDRVVFENIYGPTEITIYATRYSLKDPKGFSVTPIGKPVQNSRSYILDRCFRLVPIGVPGELCISGDGLAAGYLNQPELTHEKFVGNPYEPGCKMYRTGDLVRWLPDGNIEYLGRIDHQVKVRGFRIELGEIENRLLRMDGLKEAVVIAKEDKQGSNYLCAYYVSESEPSNKELREFIRKELPDYMVPSYFIRLDKLPLNANGKIDRKALPEPGDIQAHSGEYIAPGNEMEEKLAALWKEVLGTAKPGIKDNFFDLGGHSLKAIHLSSLIRKEFSVDMPVSEIFSRNTIEEMAGYIQNTGRSDSDVIKPAVRKEFYPMSSAQKRLFILDKMMGRNIIYNMPGIFYVEGKLDSDRLKMAFRKLIQRHETLRTSFGMVGEEAVQRVHDKAELVFERNTCDEAAARTFISSFIRPFDLGAAPLFRVGLLQTAEYKYILLFDMHHIISDGVSMEILVRECLLFYSGQELEPLTIQYKDFSEWQNELLKSERIKSQEDYWFGRFRDEVPVLSLPLDYPRPLVQSTDGDRAHYKIDRETTAKLKLIISQTGTTFYMAVLAVFNVLLSKYSGQEDIVVGSPISGRAHADLEGIIGMFVNTLAMRNYPAGEKTFLEFLSEVKTNALSAYENQDYQFEMLVDKLSIARDIGRNPLFDVMLDVQNREAEESSLSDITIRPYESGHSISKFDMTLYAVDADEGIELQLEYCTKLFDKTTMVRFLSHFHQILKTLAESPNIRLKEIEMVTPDERRLILESFNRTATEYPRNKTLQDLFEEQAKQNPERTALIFEEKQMTYAELNKKANQLAHLLLKQGVKAGALVGIMTERSMEMLVGILAILKAGGAYVPVDPDYPYDRVQFMLEDTGVDVLLIQGALNDKYPLSQVLIDLDSPDSYKGPVSNPKNPNKPDDLAYIIYTSGSTGKPKGVMIEHRNVVRLVKNTNYLPFDHDDRFLQTGAIVFDASTLEFWGSLLNGLCLVIVGEDTILNAEKLGQAIQENAVTTMWLTSPLFNQLADQDPAIFKGLKYLLVGGDVLSPNHINRVRKICGGLRIINGYGPTENTTFSLTYNISRNFEDKIPIGSPISNSTAYILGKGGKLQPMGAWGELCVGGDGVGRGYLNRPELTQERFVEDPFKPGAKMYRTGDLARWLPDGSVEFGGRIDQQVKIRGFRIELGEIESRLSKLEGVSEAFVMAREEADGSKYLCAYYSADTEIDGSRIREFLSQELPNYMVPSYFVQLEKLPLTTNGKVDKKALPEPLGNRSGSSEYEAPGNPVEEKLVEIWSSVLGVEGLGINDNFFAMGGQSLKASIVISRIYKEMNIDIPMKEIFQTPTVKEIALFIRSAEGGIYTSIEPVEKRETYPVSSAQKRQFVLSKLDGASIGYNIPGVIVLDGVIDRERIEQAVQALVKRHDVFRTSFEMLGGEPVQRVHDEVELSVEFQEAAFDRVQALVKEFIRPFDLSKAPLLRVQLVKTGAEQHVLMFDMHHIISDGTSIGILIGEFADIYNGKDLPELRIQYKDFSEWQNKLLKTDYKVEQEAFWLKSFEGDIPVLNLLTDFNRPVTQRFEGKILKVGLSSDSAKALNKLASETGSTPFMVILALFNILLSKYSGQEDIIIGTPIAGRPHADLESLIGMFVNTLALRNHPVADKTFLDFLSEVKENSLQAYRYQDYQFEDLLENLDLYRDMSRNPLFDVMFVMQNLQDNQKEIENIQISNYDFETGTTKFDLTLNAMGDGSNMTFVFEYCTSLFQTETIRRMGTHLVSLIESVLKDPGQKIALLNCMPGDELTKILWEYNNTKADYPAQKTIQELIEEQVQKTPDHTAVMFGDSSLTYRELNEKSNQMARLLRNKGVGADVIVGLMIERSLEMMVGIFAIIKAGGAYLPIDPEYPTDRINYLLTDSKAKVVLARREYLETVTCTIDSMDIAAEIPSSVKKDNLDRVTGPHSLLYIIYTSGSTGNPKGVMIENYSLINRLNWMQKMYPIGEGDVILQKTPYTFDVSVWELFWWALCGAKVAMLEPKGEKYPEIILKALEKYKVTTMHFVPSMLGAFLDYLVNNSVSNDVTSLKQVFASGEALTVNQVNLFNELLYKKSWVKLHNLYGPTEATVDVSYYPCSVQETLDRVPIGKPIDNIQLYVMDRRNKTLQPVGIPGELCISGDGLARGYLNRPELTEEKFVDNPFVPGSKMYRTGDLARWLPDGNIEYLGRIDFQVKIRGYRIELGEIESRLLQYENIKEAVVIAKEDADNNKYLCAYLVPSNEVTVKELRDYLGQNLPEYMIPSFFVNLTKMPLTQSGKIDRKALPEPQRNISTGIEYEAPATELEEQLADIWQKVLGAEKIGVRDNFFALGGDSIKALQVAARLQAINWKLDIKDLFQNPNIKDLCKTIVPVYRLADQGLVEGEVGLIPIQRWFFSKQMADQHHFNQSLILYHPEGFDENTIRVIFDKIVTHHDALRMVYSQDQNGIVQKNRGLSGKLYSLDIIDLSDSGNYEDTVTVEAGKIQQSINLQKGPLMKLCLFKTNKGDHLLIVIHHLVIDGISWRILIEDITTLYSQIKIGAELVLPLKTDPYKDWADKLPQYIKTQGISKELKIWKDFESKAVQRLPRDFIVDNYLSKDSNTLQLSMNEKETDQLIHQVNQAYNTGVGDILLTALGLAMKEWTGNDYYSIAMEGHGREEVFADIDISRTVGWFTSLYPVVLDLASSGNTASLIKNVKESLRIIPNKGLGYGILRYMTPIEQLDGLTFSIEPEICFNYLGQFDQDVQADIVGVSNLNGGEPISPNNKRFYTFDISAMVADGKLSLSITYNQNEYLEETVRRLLDRFADNLRMIMAHCLGLKESEFTPSDFDAKGLEIQEMDNVLDNLMDKLNQ